MEMYKFQHFLLTRFNIPMDWDKDKNNNQILDKKWMKHRYELFEKICFPSIKNQTNDNFIWFVFFSIDTDNIYKEKIKKLESQFKNFIPVYIKKTTKFKDIIVKEISKMLSRETEFVLTTRIDNDDAFHKDAINVIQSNFLPKNNTLIDIINGFCLQIEPQLMISKIKYPFNPFISIVEESNGFGTVFKKQHDKWDETNYKIISISNKTLWLQTIHDRNISNGFRLGYYVLNMAVLKNFNIKINTGYSFVTFFISSLLNNLKISNVLIKKLISKLK